MTVWDQLTAIIASRLEAEDFRHWFGATTYASDSGDQITVWVPSEGIRRHLTGHYQLLIDDALEQVGRRGTAVRFVVAGEEDEVDEDEKV